MCKICAFSRKNLPKGRNYTYLEDPGVYIYIDLPVVMIYAWYIYKLFIPPFLGLHGIAPNLMWIPLTFGPGLHVGGLTRETKI